MLVPRGGCIENRESKKYINILQSGIKNAIKRISHTHEVSVGITSATVYS